MSNITNKHPSTIAKYPEIMYIKKDKLHVFIKKELIDGFKLSNFSNVLFQYKVDKSIKLPALKKNNDNPYLIKNIIKKLKPYIVNYKKIKDDNIIKNKLIVFYDSNFIDHYLTVIFDIDYTKIPKIPFLEIDKSYYVDIGLNPKYIDKLYRIDLFKFKNNNLKTLDEFFSFIIKRS